LFFWLENVDLAIKRVRTRVLEGGYYIDTNVIKKRCVNRIKNLFEIYLDIANEVLIFDNSFGGPELIAEKSFDSEMKILSTIKFNNLKKNWNERI
jgi:predicted ABC-type ATPase